MIFSEHVEARCVDRQAHFMRAFYQGKPLRPKGDWTIGDLIFLAGTVNTMLAELPSLNEDEFKTELHSVWGAFGTQAAEAVESLPQGRHPF